jgi:hypothetical protein
MRLRLATLFLLLAAGWVGWARRADRMNILSTAAGMLAAGTSSPRLTVPDVYRQIREVNSRQAIVTGQVTHALGALGHGWFRVAADDLDDRGILVVAEHAIPSVGDRVEVAGLLCQEVVLDQKQLIVLHEVQSEGVTTAADAGPRCGISIWSVIRTIPWARVLLK